MADMGALGEEEVEFLNFRLSGEKQMKAESANKNMGFLANPKGKKRQKNSSWVLMKKERNSLGGGRKENCYSGLRKRKSRLRAPEAPQKAMVK